MDGVLGEGGRRPLVSLEFNPGWFHRRSRRTQGQRGRWRRTNEGAGLRLTNDRRARQGGNQPAIVAAFASGHPPDAMTVMVPGRRPAAGTVFAGLAAHPAGRFARLERHQLFENWSEQSERKNPHPRRSNHAAEKAEDDRFCPRFADRDQDASIPRRKRTPVLPPNRQLIKRCGGKKGVDAAGGLRRRTARWQDGRKRKGGRRLRTSALLAGRWAGQNGPRPPFQSPAGSNR